MTRYQPTAASDRLAAFMLAYISWRRFGYPRWKALRAAWRVSAATR